MSVFWTPGYAAATPWPMMHARILHTAVAGTITASTEVEGFEALNAGSPNTYSYWQPSETPASWEIDFGAAVSIDAVGIAAATLAGRVVEVDTYAGGSWTERISCSPADDSALLMLFEAVSAEKVRVRIEGTVPVVGVIYAGQALVMPVREFAKMGPMRHSPRTEFAQNLSEGGQWLGRSVARIAKAASFGWDYLPASFVDGAFVAFQKAARTRPFFLASLPSIAAAECHFAWVKADIVPARMGVRGYYTVGFDATGHARD
jgi:hypothetical protein